MRNEIPTRGRRTHDRSERGDTLIEVLLAVIVLGLAATALIVAFALSLSASAEHRSITTMDTVLRSAADEANSQLQKQSSTLWGNCGGSALVSFTNLPTGYSATVNSVQYWSGSAWQGGCVANAPQLVQLRVVSISSTQYISFIVSDPLARPVQVGTVPSQLIVATQPGTATAGLSFPVQPVIEVADAAGHVVTSDLSTMSLSIASGPTGQTLTGCHATEFYGVFSFNGCTLNASGAYTLTASDNDGVTPVTTQAFTVMPAAPTHFVFSSLPVSGVASLSTSIGPMTIQEEDAFNNPSPAAQTVNLVSTTSGLYGFSTTQGGASTTSVSIPSGASSVNFYYADTASGSPTITASGALTGVSQVEIVTAGPPAQFNFVAGATGVASATATVGPITVQEMDSLGNLTTSAETVNLSSNSTGTVKFAATSGGTAVTSVAIPSGSSSVNFYYGDTKAGTPTLTASGALTSDTQTVTINPASPAQFNIVAGATGAASATATVGPITVQEQDSFGNLTTSAETVNLSSTSTGTFEFAAASGGTAVTSVAIPSGSSSVNFYYGDTKAGTPTLTASGALTSDTQTVTINPASPAQFNIVAGATGAASATATVGPITVQEQDSFGNLTTSAETVNLSSTSTGTFEFAAASGGTAVTSVAIPSGSSSVNFYYGDTKAGSPTLTTSGALTSDTQTVTINPASPAQFVITSAPFSGVSTVTANLGPITVLEQDLFGNPTTTAETLTLSSSSTGTYIFNKTLNATTPTGSTSTISIPSGSSSVSFYYGDTKAGSPTLTASGALTSATQAETITVGSAAKLAVSTQPPSSATAGALFTVAVTVQDVGGNTVTSSSAPITLAMGSNPGGTSLFCVTNPVNASSGVATFSCWINKAAVGYTVTATSSSLTSATSNAFTVVAAGPSQLAITTSPVSGAASLGASLGLITVQEQDAFNNPATAAETLTLSSSSSGTYIFNKTQNATTPTGSTTTISIPSGSNSVSFYYGDSLVGTPTLTAAASGLASATQGATITAAPVHQLVITTSPVSGGASLNTSIGLITVQEQDAFGNLTTTAETLTLSSNSSGTYIFNKTLNATTPTGSTTTISIPSGSNSVSFYYGDNKSGSPTLTAAASGLTSATQVATISPAPVHQLAFTSSSVSGSASSGANLGLITVQEQDLYGNPTTTAETLTLSSSSTGTYIFNKTQNATTPTGSTTTISIPSGSNSVSFYYGDTLAGSPTLTAAAAGLTSATQGATITAAAVHQLDFTSAPVSGIFTSSVKASLGLITVQEQDAFGNPTTTAETLTLSSNSTGTYIFNKTLNATAPTGTTSTITIPSGSNSVSFYYGDTKGPSTPTLTAAASGLASDTQVETVTGTGTHLVITSAPISGVHGTTATYAFTITLEDSANNATTSASAITVTMSSSTPGSGTAKFSRTSGGTSATTVSLPINTSSVTAYYAYSKAGSPVITVSGSGLSPNGTQTETMS